MLARRGGRGLLVTPLVALDGDPAMHDPSTIVLHNGTFYAIGTGTGLPISMSEDGWTWRRAGTLMQGLPGGRPGSAVLARGGNNTWAPDVIRSGDKYFVYYSAPGTQPKAAIGLLVGTTLDPRSPDFTWEDRGPVVWSDGVEDSNAIDPGVFRDPTNGSLWLTYGSYFGYIRLVELNPKTGQAAVSRTEADQHCHQQRSVDRDLSRRLVLPAGHAWIVLRRRELQLQHPHGPVTEGHRSLHRQHRASTCCREGEAVCRLRRPLHRPRTFRPARSRRRRAEVLDATMKRISIEAASACSTSVRCSGATGGPWPERTSRKAPIRSNPRGPGPRSSWPCRDSGRRIRGRGGRGGGGRGGGRWRTGAATPIPSQDAAQVSANWPTDAVDVRMSPYMLQAQQKWTVAPVANAGGYPGSAYFRITIAGTDRDADRDGGSRADGPAGVHGGARAVVADRSADRCHLSGDSQGDARNAKAPLALSAVGSSMPTLTTFNPNSDRQRWILKAP